MADIRRNTPDIQPVNFIRPGVEDRSATVLAEGLGNVIQGAVKVDAMAAQERFGEALETLRAQHISSQTPVTEDDVDVGIELTGSDKRSLKDFEGVLGTSAKAVEQGRMSDMAFRLRAERLYRVAISKRPGLASEFRKVAGELLGFDVVGASVDMIAKQQDEELRAAAAAQKSKADIAMDNFKFQREEFVKAGIGEAAFLKGPGPEADAFFEAHGPRYIAVKRSKAELEAVETVANASKAMGTINQSHNQQRYVAHVNALTIGFPQAIDQTLQSLEQQGVADDPNAVYAAGQGLLQQLDTELANLNAQFAEHEVSPSFRSEQMGRITFMRDQLMKRLSGERNAEYSKNVLNWMQQTKEISIRSNDDFNTMAVLYQTLPEPVADRLAKDMETPLMLTVAQLMQEGTSFSANNAYAPAAVNRIVSAVWPRGEAGDPVAVEKASQALTRALMSFYLSPDEDFNVGRFTQDGLKAGVVKQINDFMPKMKGLTEEQKASMAAAMAGSTANSVRVLAKRMFGKDQSLQGKIDVAGIFTPDENGNVFRPKAGVKLTDAQKQIVAQYNAQVNVPLVTAALGKLGGFGSMKEAWKYVASTHKDVKAAREKTQAAKAKPLTSNRGPATRWW